MAVKPCHLIARIDLSAIVHNCRIIRQRISPACRICVAIKSNAYGHGVEVVLPGLVQADIEMLCVATMGEADQLLTLNWRRPILLLGSEISIYQGKEKTERAQWIVENEIWTTVTNKRDVEALASAARQLKKQALIHYKLDTGMSRMGLGAEELFALMEDNQANPYLKVEGLYTHLATADEADKSFALAQLKQFVGFVERLHRQGMPVPVLHAANSAATIDLPQSHFDMVRPGISIYGYHSSVHMQNKPDLQPAMKIVSYITLIKRVRAKSYIGYGRTYQAAQDMLTAVVPIGYCDFYDRRLSNTAQVMIAGRLAPIVGRISMDQTIVDITQLEREGVNVSVGQEVVVVDNRRDRPNSIESLARQLGTIPNEILTKINHRVARAPV